jgi:hypothetical protein
MMWQERQNEVLLDRSNSEETPMAMHSNGSKNRTINARIFPLRVAVSPGHAAKMAISATLKAISDSNSAVGKCISILV